MVSLGRIEAESECAAIDPARWLRVIESHESLGLLPSRMGINPFTREPWEYKARAATAVIQTAGIPVGSIYWAMDGSPFLIVLAKEESEEAVASIVEEVARTLGAR